MSAKELNIGDYVRTKDGCICKIININDFREPSMKYGVEASYFKDIMFIGDENIIKSSPNIIELTEEKDLVKIEYYSSRYEERVIRLFEVTHKGGIYTNLENARCSFMLINNEFNDNDKELKPIIKSILTCEMFESMEYEVE